tara:strand:+ start:287 stop:580 length:294 start_codon:yes stop_codon:yes gene_type:complete
MKRDLGSPLAPTPKPSFRTAFSSAKKSGKKTFNWKNSEYTTETAEERAKNMSTKNVFDAQEKAYRKSVAAGKNTDLKKSKEEQYKSYTKEIVKRGYR